MTACNLGRFRAAFQRPTPAQPLAPPASWCGHTERLHATVARIVEELSPQQIVLFGSAVREEMHPGSDIDLLVIRERLNGEPKTEQKRRRAADDGSYEADLVVMDRATAEAGRDSITKVQGIALEEGRTIYTRPDVEPVLTGPTYRWNGAEMVKKTKFEPEEATRLVEDARMRPGRSRICPTSCRGTGAENFIYQERVPR